MHVWLIGAGNMAQAYIKVLNALKTSYTVIGRSKTSADQCKALTQMPVVSGGIEGFLKDNPPIASHAIVAVSSEKLADVTQMLLRYGVPCILVEKPAGLSAQAIKNINELAKEHSATVLLAYNRRFYASVERAKQIIEEDGGILSGNFEFTEWSHVIENLQKSKEALYSWVIGNSSHVIDLAFYLMGKPKELCSFTSGALSWHPSSSVFAGAGITQNHVLFSYHANWESAGRWGVEILTKKRKLILRPMETLSVIMKGTVTEEKVPGIDYTLDETYKPGIYREVATFLRGDFSKHCTIQEQSNMIDIYYKIANYSDVK